MTASVGAIREKGDPVSAKVNADMYIQCLRQIIKDVATEKEDYETFIAFNFSYWIEGAHTRTLYYNAYYAMHYKLFHSILMHTLG